MSPHARTISPAPRSSSAPDLVSPPLPAAPPRPDSVSGGPLRRALAAPVDISFLVFFRVCFGAAVLWTVWQFHAKGLITSLYVAPPFHFTYHGFAWVRPWPGAGMYAHFAVLAALAACV